jgi:hypothetical protein
VTAIGGYDHNDTGPGGPAPAPRDEDDRDDRLHAGVGRAGLQGRRAPERQSLVPQHRAPAGRGHGHGRGGRGYDEVYGVRWTHPAGEARPVELLDAGSSTWRLGAAQAEDRGYHSTAALLPDGRVLSSGDDFNGTDVDADANGHDDDGETSDSIELYSPPYLFRGDRPVITSAPKAWGTASRSGWRPAAGRAVLMAPSATTHGADMTQRHVELAVDSRDAEGMVLRAPATGGIAPPGMYMLFVLDDKGVPSVASWVRVQPGEVPGLDRPPAKRPDPEPPTEPEARDTTPVTPPRLVPPTPTPASAGDGIPPTARVRIEQAGLRTLRSRGVLGLVVSVDEPSPGDGLGPARRGEQDARQPSRVAQAGQPAALPAPEQGRAPRPVRTADRDHGHPARPRGQRPAHQGDAGRALTLTHPIGGPPLGVGPRHEDWSDGAWRRPR